MAAHSLSTISSSSERGCGNAHKRRPIRSQTFSIGERSRETSGHGSTESSSKKYGIRDAPRSGRPASSVNEENIVSVKKLLENDRHITYHQIEQSLDIPVPEIHFIRHEYLKNCRYNSQAAPPDGESLKLAAPPLLTLGRRVSHSMMQQKTLSLGIAASTTYDLEQYFKEKSALAKKLNLDKTLLLEALTDGMPDHLKKYLIAARVQEPSEWYKITTQLKLSTNKEEPQQPSTSTSTPVKKFNSNSSLAHQYQPFPRTAAATHHQQEPHKPINLPPYPCKICASHQLPNQIHFHRDCPLKNNTHPKRINPDRNNVKHLLTSAHHPETNAKVERLNSTIINRLRCEYNANLKIPWTKYIPKITESYNETVHTTTGFTPKFLYYGIQPQYIEHCTETHTPIEKARKLAIERTLKSHEHSKQLYDIKHPEPIFKEGDQEGHILDMDNEEQISAPILKPSQIT
ncbi:hypothetical protein LAZ67_13001406 [Cordylochernes scorpioides]|uniref:Integrase catalytic domain-containing protein n=1 Tax=Cordylochernes scorpioides TaxID=51811 RepID=A0ABY6L4K8_9ARAC|nr:hypothetical protein LAZ67_13001406 [Cordylochernes scorpioides]